MTLFCCDPSDHLQESPGPPGPKSQKSLKKSVFGGPQKSPRKYPKKSKNTPKIGLLGVFFDFFGYFRGLFCGPPKTLFLRLFCDFGPGGPGDSCKWSLGSQLFRANWASTFESLLGHSNWLGLLGALCGLLITIEVPY